MPILKTNLFKPKLIRVNAEIIPLKKINLNKKKFIIEKETKSKIIISHKVKGLKKIEYLHKNNIGKVFSSIKNTDKRYLCRDYHFFCGPKISKQIIKMIKKNKADILFDPHNQFLDIVEGEYIKRGLIVNLLI